MARRGQVIPLAQYEAGRPTPYHQPPPARLSPDEEYAVSGRTLRDWARQLADNSSICEAILEARTTTALGAGLSYEPLVKDRNGELIPEINDAIRRWHSQWAKRPEVTGEQDLADLEELVWRTWDTDGECFLRKVVRETYQLQLVPTEWIPGALTDRLDNGRFIVHGIEVNQWRERQAYYIDAYQTDLYYPVGVSRSLRVSADQMIHLARRRYVNQTRGVTLFHPIIFRIADIAEYQQSHRLAARASADLFASINREPDAVVSTTDEQGNQVDIAEERGWEYERLQMIDGLAPGEKVNFHKPENPNQNAVDFVREELRAIASATAVGFSQIAQVFDASYAAQRLEVVDTYRKCSKARRRFIDKVARPGFYQEPLRFALLAGQLALPARALRRADPETLTDVGISGPPMPVIDPVKDRHAWQMDQENGWDSRHGIIRRQGNNPADVDAEREQDTMTGETDESVPD